MSITMEEIDTSNLMEVHLSGRLVKEDYLSFMPEAERLIQLHGKIRVLVVMSDFHGWDSGALWEDIKFDVKHFNHISRVAIVGEKKWQKAMSHICRPFTTAKIRYFDHDELAAAREWLNAD